MGLLLEFEMEVLMEYLSDRRMDVVKEFEMEIRLVSMTVF